MYRRFYRNDELLSNVLISFALLLLFGMLISWKLVGVDTYDAEMIVYIVFGSLSLILFGVTLVVFLFVGRSPITDVALDFNNREVKTFNNRFTYSFDDITLYSYNKRHRQVRFLMKRRLIGFSIDEMTHKDLIVSQDQLLQLSDQAVIVEPKILYNYHLLTILVFVGFTILYTILASTTDIQLFGTYIPTYYVIALCAILSTAVYYLNHYRMKKVREKHRSIADDLEEENTTSPLEE